ncbi:MAG: hypothetical protein QW328_09940 [Nitrososphaerota archaeon]
MIFSLMLAAANPKKLCNLKKMGTHSTLFVLIANGSSAPNEIETVILQDAKGFGRADLMYAWNIINTITLKQLIKKVKISVLLADVIELLGDKIVVPPRNHVEVFVDRANAR